MEECLEWVVDPGMGGMPGPGMPGMGDPEWVEHAWNGTK